MEVVKEINGEPNMLERTFSFLKQVYLLEYHKEKMS